MSAIKVRGGHRDGCSAVENVAIGEWKSPWRWMAACENDPAGIVIVPCDDDDCPASILIETTDDVFKE